MVDADTKLINSLKERAHNLGFDVCRIAKADVSPETSERLEQFIDNQHHGTMGWLETTLERRKSPTSMWPSAKTAIMLGMNYGPDENPLQTLDKRTSATISVYARHRDYHDVIKGKLKELAGWFASQSGDEVKVFVDTAPLMEKPLAERAGVGWQGKHTNLVSRDFGSWLFLGSILTSKELRADKREEDHCGSCTSCLDICPTNAFPAPYKLDARRCISYLTVEHAGPIPFEFRERIGNRIYGCDDCLAVCPWNKYAKTTREAKLAAREDLKEPTLDELILLDETAFRKKFSGSPIKRIGRNRFMRNVLIAIGNSKANELKPSIFEKLNEPDSMVRGAAIWALSKLEDKETFADMRSKALLTETEESVRREWFDNG